VGPPLSQADAASARLLDGCHTNRHAQRATPPVASFGIHVSPDSHFTVYRIIQDSFRMFLYSPSVLDPQLLHRLARSVYVHDPPHLTPPTGKQARIQPHFPFLFPFACVRFKHFLPLRIPQLCRGSCEYPSRSAFAFSFVLSRLIQHRTSGSRGAISCHTHTLSLSFAPSRSPRERGPASDLTFPRTHYCSSVNFPPAIHFPFSIWICKFPVTPYVRYSQGPLYAI